MGRVSEREPAPASAPSRLRAIPGAFVIAIMVAGAAVGIAKIPQCFSPLSLRFVAGTLLPWSIVASAPVVLGLALVAGRARPLAAFLAGAAALLAAAGVTARLCFPISAPPFDLVLAGVGLGPLAAAAVYGRRLYHWSTPLGLAIGAILGIATVIAQRAPDPSTRPALCALPVPLAGQSLGAGPRELADGVFVTSEGTLRLRRAETTVEVRPLLSFHSRSPDRAWTLLAPPGTNASSTDWQWARSDGDTIETAVASRELAHRVRLRRTERGYALAAFSRLDRPVFTHLNRFSAVVLRAPDAAMRIGSCDRDIAVLPSDYPEGRPMRFAYFDGTHVRVVEATSGEKGPFRTLCAAPHRREDALRVGLRSRGIDVAQVVLHDWSLQASTEPSPTAGWGVPQNAIELFREGNTLAGGIELNVVLAATGVGCGWDSVGHAPGVYRNRIDVSF